MMRFLLSRVLQVHDYPFPDTDSDVHETWWYIWSRGLNLSHFIYEIETDIPQVTRVKLFHTLFSFEDVRAMDDGIVNFGTFQPRIINSKKVSKRAELST